MSDYSALDDELLDYQANTIDPADDEDATVAVATFPGAILLATTRAAYFGQRQRVARASHWCLRGDRPCLTNPWIVGRA